MDRFESAALDSYLTGGGDPGPEVVPDREDDGDDGCPECGCGGDGCEDCGCGLPAEAHDWGD